jgi:hypothetical protein
MFEALGVRTPVSDSFIDLSTGLHMPEEVLDSRLHIPAGRNHYLHGRMSRPSSKAFPWHQLGDKLFLKERGMSATLVTTVIDRRRH